MTEVMKTPKTAKRALALGIIMTTLINQVESRSIGLGRVGKQCSVAYGGFVAKTNQITALAIGNEIKELWVDIINEHNISYSNKEISVLVFYLCKIINIVDFREFYLVAPFIPDNLYEEDKELHLRCSSLAIAISESCDEMFNTKPPFSLFKKKVIKKPKVKLSKLELREQKELKRKARQEESERKQRLRLTMKKMRPKVLSINNGELSINCYLDDRVTIIGEVEELSYYEEVLELASQLVYTNVKTYIPILLKYRGVQTVELI